MGLYLYAIQLPAISCAAISLRWSLVVINFLLIEAFSVCMNFLFSSMASLHSFTSLVKCKFSIFWIEDLGIAIEDL